MIQEKENKILLITENVKSSQLLLDLLHEFGYSTDMVEKSAWESLERYDKTYELFLFDYYYVDKELFTSLKEINHLALPIILLTANKSILHDFPELEKYIKHLFTKPIQVEKFRNTIRSLINTLSNEKN